MANDSVRTVAPLCRIGFPNIFSPKVDTQVDKSTGETKTTEKYSAQLVFDGSVAEELKALKAQVRQLGIEEFGEHFDTLVEQRSVRWPFRNGDEINPKTGAPRFPEGGITYINVSSYSPVSVVSRYSDPTDPNSNGRPAVVKDPSQLWPGEYVKAAVTFKAYKRKDGNGIACYVNGLQLWHEGERWGGSFNAQESFDAEGERPAADASSSLL